MAKLDAEESRRIREQQGSTFLWTEVYGHPGRGTTVREELRDMLFAGALLVLAAGVAGFLTLEPAYADTGRAPQAEARAH
ncbi:MAG TPA: hypothetical protein VII13_06855 [Vicinamibacteria bacterium]